MIDINHINIGIKKQEKTNKNLENQNKHVKIISEQNDGFFNYDGGWWVLPAGHIEQHETAQDAAIREVKEELDIDIAPFDIKCVLVMSNIV